MKKIFIIGLFLAFSSLYASQSPTGKILQINYGADNSTTPATPQIGFTLDSDPNIWYWVTNTPTYGIKDMNDFKNIYALILAAKANSSSITCTYILASSGNQVIIYSGNFGIRITQ